MKTDLFADFVRKIGTGTSRRSRRRRQASPALARYSAKRQVPSSTQVLEPRLLLTTTVGVTVANPGDMVIVTITITGQLDREQSIDVGPGEGLLEGFLSVTDNGTDLPFPDVLSDEVQRIDVLLLDPPPTLALTPPKPVTVDLSGLTDVLFPNLATDEPSISVTTGGTIGRQQIIGSPLNDLFKIGAKGAVLDVGPLGGDGRPRPAIIDVSGGPGDDFYDIEFGDEKNPVLSTIAELQDEGDDTVRFDAGGAPGHELFEFPGDPSLGIKGVSIEHLGEPDPNVPGIRFPAGTLLITSRAGAPGNISAAPDSQSFETIIGSLGNDFFGGSPTTPRTYRGREGNDNFAPLLGDVLSGGPGNDAYLFGDNGSSEPVTVFIEELPGQGTDELDFSVVYGEASTVAIDGDGRPVPPADADFPEGAGVMVDLQMVEMASYLNSQGARFTINALSPGQQSEIENVNGSELSDVILGNEKNNVLKGNIGGDIIGGRGGNDTVDGGIGMDFLHAGPGEDSVIGGSGADTALDKAETTTIEADVTLEIDDLADPIPLHGTTTYLINAENRGEDVATGTSVLVTGDETINIVGQSQFTIGTFLRPPNFPEELPQPDMLLPGVPQILVTGGKGRNTGTGTVTAEISALEQDPAPNNRKTEDTQVTGGGWRMINRNPAGEQRKGEQTIAMGGRGAARIIDAKFRPGSEDPDAIAAGQAPGTLSGNSQDNDRDNVGRVANVVASLIDAEVFGENSGVRAGGAGNPVRFDTNAAGAGGEGDVHDASISDDGRFIAFTSESALLSDVPDLNGATDVFLKDMVTQELITISKSADGSFTANDRSLQAIVSPDGRYVAYHSNATNLIDGFTATNDPTFDRDVFLFDRETRTTQLVSVSTDDAGTRTTGANGRSRAHDFSADGRFLVFYSQATDLVAGFVDLNGTGNGRNADLYVFDTMTQTIELVSVALDGVSGGDATVTNSFDHVSVGITDDKLLVAFEADAKNLQDSLPDATDGTAVFLREYPRDATTGNLLPGTTRAVSLNAAGTQVRQGSDPVLTPDGRFLTYLTTAGDATDTPDSLGHRDLVLRNLETGTNRLITIAHDGTTADSRTFGGQDISDDGRYVVFKSVATNLVPNFVDGNGSNSDDIYVRDTLRDRTTLITLGADGVTSGNTFAGGFAITGDGEVVYFDSRATNLVANVIDENDNSNVFSSSAHIYLQFNQPDNVGNDTLTLTRDGDDLVVHSRQNGEVARRLLADTTGIRIVGTANDETLVVDFSNGVFDVDDLFFNGVSGAGDSIVITGGTFDSVQYDPGTEKTGAMLFSNGAVVPVVYTNVSSVLDETAAAHRTFAPAIIATETGDPVDLTIRVTDNDDPSDGLLRAADGGLFIPYTFAVPTSSLTVQGNEANDTIVVESLDSSFTGTVILDGGAGHDTLDGSASPVPVILRGSDGNDRLLGTPMNDLLDGGFGNDELRDGHGDDNLDGGPDNDTFLLMPGSDDVLTDVSGDDTLDVSLAASGITLNLDDLEAVQTVDAAGNTLQLLSRIEHFVGSSFNDSVTVRALNVPRTLDGGDGADRLTVGGDAAFHSQNGSQLVFDGPVPVKPVQVTGFETIEFLDPDLGDAPIPYPTTLADDGARHAAVGPRLGTQRDAEADGLPSASADADDQGGAVPDDEDGVAFVAATLNVLASSNTNAQVVVDLQNADPISNRLDAWVDFNQDGDWDDPGEQIFTDFHLGTTDGLQTLSFTIPPANGGNVVAGTTFARFRLSTSGGLSPTGPAADGEVEDHPVDIRAPRFDAPVARDEQDRWHVERSDGTRFVHEVIGQWPAAGDYVDVHMADVNGDGHVDLVGRQADSGHWVVSRSDSVSLQTEVWGRWAPVAWVDVHVADVNGDGLDDLVGRQETDGRWWVGLSDGIGRFTNQLWGRWVPRNWRDVNIADVNNDGHDDIVGRDPFSGVWWVALSDGVGSLTNQPWGLWTLLDWQDAHVVDLNLDGFDDLVGRDPRSGHWWAAVSDGIGRFDNQRWGHWSPTVAWVDVQLADPNGDGLPDIVGRDAADGDWWVAQSDGAGGFENRLWGRWDATISWQDVRVADVDNDGNSDLVGRQQNGGRVWVARSNGVDRLNNELWGRWDPAAVWRDVRILDDLLSAGI